MNSIRTRLSSVRFRLVLILAVGVLLYGFYFLGTVKTHHAQENQLFKNRLKSKSSIFDLTVKNTETQLHTFASDYTYWDDMVAFVDGGGKNKTFSDENLVPGLTTYGADAIWVYDLHDNLVYTTSSLGDKFDGTVTAPINTSQIGVLFSKNGVYHYFVDTNSGIFDVYAATIHPSSDPDRKTPAHGYFFAATLLDSSYLSGIGKAVEGSVKTESGTDSLKDVTSSYNSNTGTITFGKELDNFRGQPIGALAVNYQAADLKANNRTENRSIIAGLAILSAIAGFSMILLYRWIIRPMGRIQAALEKQAADPIAKLLRSQDEFGSMARLISQALAQKQLLVTEKASVEQEVKDRTAQLENEKNTLETVLNNLPVGVHVVEAPSGKTKSLNAAGLKILGINAPPDSASGSYSQGYDVITADGKPYPEDDIPMNITLREGRTVAKDDLVIRRPDGSRVFLRVIAAPIHSNDGIMYSAVAVFEDISGELSSRAYDSQTE
jgi:PAS domain-containing protein